MRRRDRRRRSEREIEGKGRRGVEERCSEENTRSNILEFGRIIGGCCKKILLYKYSEVKIECLIICIKNRRKKGGK